VTADNASNNDTTATKVSKILTNRSAPCWIPKERKLSCLGHVISLGIIEDYMSEITQIAVIETKQAIWDYDPSLPENRAVIGGLDVIAIIRTLAIKVVY
ncbi:hypothetical protein BKA93DRAFT_740149, partial [Sparassis latifolia]